MTCGILTAAGVDLDTLFLPRVSSPIADVGFKTTAGQDLSDRFEPIGGATAISATGLKTGAGTDLANLFRDINAPIFTGLTNYNVDVVVAVSSGTATFKLTNAGDIQASPAGGGALVDVGDWIQPKSGMSLYAARAYNQVTAPGTSGTFGSDLALNTDRTWSIVRVGGVPVDFTTSFDLDIKRISDSAVMRTVHITIRLRTG